MSGFVIADDEPVTAVAVSGKEVVLLHKKRVLCECGWEMLAESMMQAKLHAVKHSRVVHKETGVVL